MTVVVRMRHVRAAKLCSGGARAWFARHGLSWNDFLRDGLPAETLEKMGDPLAARAVTAARKEDVDGRRR